MIVSTGPSRTTATSAASSKARSGPPYDGRPARRLSLRMRLTAVYTLLFLIGGAALLGATYALVEHATGNQITYVSPDGDYTISLSGDPSRPPAAGAGSQSSDTRADGGDGLAPPPERSAEELRSLALQQHAAAMRQLLTQGGLALALVTLASTGLSWYLAGRMLDRLRAIAGTVQEITASNLHRRLALTGRRDELTDLGDTFDALLDRLEASFDTQRQFVANASHELRTPLARQRTIGQVALSDADAGAAELREAHEKILAAGREQEQLIEALLELARGQAALHRNVPVDLPVLVGKAIRSQGLDDLAGRVTGRLQAAIAQGDPRLIERLVLNLVSNAVRHSPEGSNIDISTRDRDGEAILAIGNHGPTMTDDDIATLVQPFRRGVADRTARDQGLGLGLAIVHAIARAHDARLEIAPREGGGLVVTVAFTAATINAYAETTPSRPRS